MTVFVAHAPANREAAEALEKFLERRGQFVELDDGSTALRPVQSTDVVVLLLSKDFVFAPDRLRLEQRALDAWTEQRLIVVRLDQGAAPVGLRDLPTIDASLGSQREAFEWREVATAVGERLKMPPALAERFEDVAAQAAPAKRSAWGCGLLALLAAPGLVAAAAAISIWLANRIGPAPGTWSDLRRGIDAFGVRYGLASGVTEWLFVAALILLFAALSALVAPRRVRAPPPRPSQSATESTSSVFVSYARANAKQVLPVIEAAQAQGQTFWLDQRGVGAGQGWAGEIVRAIRAAGGVVVMCSKAAFESDHVKREIYLADRYRKRLTPVFIEHAEPPEDFEYFFAGVQQLKLFETPEAERAPALMRALGAAR
jgi:hypothetical protein